MTTLSALLDSLETPEQRNARENRELAAREAADDAELLRRVNASELRGYRLRDGDTAMLLAAYRLVRAGVVRSKRTRVGDVETIEHWTMVRGSAWANETTNEANERNTRLTICKPPARVT